MTWEWATDLILLQMRQCQHTQTHSHDYNKRRVCHRWYGQPQISAYSLQIHDILWSSNTVTKPDEVGMQFQRSPPGKHPQVTKRNKIILPSTWPEINLSTWQPCEFWLKRFGFVLTWISSSNPISMLIRNIRWGSIIDDASMKIGPWKLVYPSPTAWAKWTTAEQLKHRRWERPGLSTKKHSRPRCNACIITCHHMCMYAKRLLCTK